MSIAAHDEHEADTDTDTGTDPEPSAPRPALFPPPPELEDLSGIRTAESFLLRGGLVDAWFIRRSDVLLVTFDNLGSVGEYAPAQPWLQGRAAKAGFSILGLMASRKDWYRNDDTPRLISTLRDAGLFEGFRRIVFTGASMGGYAALAYAALVPGAVVLAFSPQTSLARSVVPFEDRFHYGARKWDWKSPAFLDAAQSSPQAAEIHLVYDPFVPEDKAHAQRVTGPHVRHLHMDHMGHRAIRMIKSTGMLQTLIEGVALGTLDAPALARGLRARRREVSWLRAVLAEAERRGHRRLARMAAKRLAKDDPDNRFARRAVRRLKVADAERPPQADTLRIVDTPPPQPPFRGEMALLSNALVIPERKTDQPLACGVLDAAGQWCELSRGWIRARKSYPQPTLGPKEHVETLPGTHLYAGHFRGHFGHFLVEATARLWALDHLRKRPDSILYLPYRGQVGAIERAIHDLAPFFRLLDIDIPIRTHGSVQRVERLIVPELGFGWGERYAGSPAYRAFMQRRLAAAAPAEGAELLYISRAKLNAQRGGILGEVVIEENLARLGYEIFYPERHPLEVQISRYKAARRIVALDGSALHLAAYVLAPGAGVAMIKRRSRANVPDYLLQFRSFCNVEIDVVDVVRTDWVAEGATRSDYRSIGELDFAALFAHLARSGYVPEDFRPEVPDAAEIRAMLDAFEDKRGAPFRPLRADEPEPAEEDE